LRDALKCKCKHKKACKEHKNNNHNCHVKPFIQGTEKYLKAETKVCSNCNTEKLKDQFSEVLVSTKDNTLICQQCVRK